MSEEIKKIYVRYDEVALKRGSRGHFEKKLKKNISRLVGFSQGHIQRIRGRLVINIPDGHDGRETIERLKRCFGLAKISPVITAKPDLEDIIQTAISLAKKHVALGHKTFKIEARRANKQFPIRSPEINVEAGGRVLEAVPELTVQVRKPDFVIRIEIFAKDVYLFSEDIAGPGGLPTGVGGRAMLLLSGGIDSPVAGWLTQKRGLHVDAVYFHSFPFTGEKTKEKVKDLASQLGRSSPDPFRLAVCSVTKIQKALQETVPEAYWTIMLRRFMVRIADKIAQEHRHFALVTGDALGQVASQTLENLDCLEGVASRMIFRPLIGFDKKEVIEIARKIDTYDLSIQPYPDCCTLFAPSHPVTRGRRELCEKLERELDVDGLVAESIAGKELHKHTNKEGMIRVENAAEVILEQDSPEQSETNDQAPEKNEANKVNSDESKLDVTLAVKSDSGNQDEAS
ncbi:MAG: tRNA 4-thiouridine(8) synthase ThiI [Planctomycetota bacterium]|nr:tRNA 4-thiouridine(8) synthase ThiI [Planctomycetota bacterium]